MRNCIYLLFLLICIHSCSSNKKKDPVTKLFYKNELLDADIAFSKLSAQKGMKQAFIEFIDSNGVMLKPGHLPIIGAKAIDFLIQENDTEYTLTWEPQFADAAASGDLGYTYGVYQLYIKATDTSIYGSYVSIWKKQHDGKWKFVLDSGNEGVGDE